MKFFICIMKPMKIFMTATTKIIMGSLFILNMMMMMMMRMMMMMMKCECTNI